MKLNIFSIYVVGLILLMSSCRTELLEPVPLTSFSDLSVFDNPARVEQQARGLYASVKNGAVLGGRYYIYHDIRSNDFINETTNNVTGFSVWNHTVQPSNINDVTNMWNFAYLAINRINVFLTGIDANADKLRGLGMTDAQLNAYRAEARFLRGVMYFSLSQLYARPYLDGNGANLGLPLRLTANVSDGASDLARATVAQVYDQVLQDFDFAEQNLPLTRATAAQNTTRAHRNSAIAMKSRVYLHMGRFNDVITEAAKMVPASAPYAASSGVPNALNATVASVFQAPYTTAESIFSMPFTENDLPGVQNGLGSYYNPGPRGIGDYTLNPDGILADARFDNDDARRSFVFLNPTNNKVYWNKFPIGPQHLDYAPVIRYAEVMLNLAEARARTAGVDAQAIDLLNAVRGRSNADGTYTAGDFASGADLVEAILFERHLEFLGEGFTASDLSRNLRPFKAKQNVAEVPAASTGYIWPIPIGELVTNKLCVQNPGY
jgi:hypothetical protein